MDTLKNEFGSFIDFIRTQGVVGLAVGFIVGKAVSDVVASIVNDIINPFIGIFLRGIGDLQALNFVLLGSTFSYGKFLSIFLNFLIVSCVVYFGVKKLKLDALVDKPKS